MMSLGIRLFWISCLVLTMAACSSPAASPPSPQTEEQINEIEIPFETMPAESGDNPVENDANLPAVERVSVDENNVVFHIRAGYSLSEQPLTLEKIVYNMNPEPELRFLVETPAEEDRGEIIREQAAFNELTAVAKVPLSKLPDNWENTPLVLYDTLGNRLESSSSAEQALFVAGDILSWETAPANYQVYIVPRRTGLVWHVRQDGAARPEMPGAEQAWFESSEPIQAKASLVLATQDLHLVEGLVTYVSSSGDVLAEYPLLSESPVDLGGHQDAPALSREASLWVNHLKGATLGAAKLFGEQMLIVVSCGSASPEDCSPRIVDIQTSSRGVEVQVDMASEGANQLDWRWLEVNSSGDFHPPVYFTMPIGDLPQLQNPDSLPPVPLDDGEAIAMHEKPDSETVYEKSRLRLSGYARVKDGELLWRLKAPDGGQLKQHTIEASAADPDWGSFVADIPLPWPNSEWSSIQLQLVTPTSKDEQYHVLEEWDVELTLPEPLRDWQSVSQWDMGREVVEQHVNHLVKVENQGNEPIQIRSNQYFLLTETGKKIEAQSEMITVPPFDEAFFVLKFTENRKGDLYFSPTGSEDRAWLVPSQ